MWRPFLTVTDWNVDAAALRDRRYGVIEVVDKRVTAVHLRPWPKYASLPELRWDAWRRGRRDGDRCWLYYNQPLGSRNFLAVPYAVSNRDATSGSLRAALVALDTIAAIKRTDAMVCEASNLRISDRLLRRWGWEPHCAHLRGRHYIRRLYPSAASATACVL